MSDDYDVGKNRLPYNPYCVGGGVKDCSIQSYDVGAGCAAVLTSSPYQTELTQLQMERLRLEEERYQHLQMLKDAEDARGPAPRWSVSVYTLFVNVVKFCATLLEKNFVCRGCKRHLDDSISLVCLQSYIRLTTYRFLG